MPPHEILNETFSRRAEKASHPLTAYLLRLMDLKASNLCVSADVTTARELLQLADTVGPSVVVLKTHHDVVSGWDFNPQTGTGARLSKLARKHGFLIFEDRKFCDIGNTVQMQYVGGSARIIDWAHIVNTTTVPGKAAVTALAEAAAHWRERYQYEVRTSVSVGTPKSDNFDEQDEERDEFPPPPTTSFADQLESPFQQEQQQQQQVQQEKQQQQPQSQQRQKPPPVPVPPPRSADGRKGSIVSVTTLTQHYESAASPRFARNDFPSSSSGEDLVYAGIEDAPTERGLLILAQMSSVGNMMNAEYTRTCVEAARDHKDFVMGFVAQENLNASPADDFLHMTPGCQLPPEGEEEGEGAVVGGDGKGQQYKTPHKLVGIKGTDIIIVGRGIIKADNPALEAERYRASAWKAYLTRVAGSRS